MTFANRFETAHESQFQSFRIYSSFASGIRPSIGAGEKSIGKIGEHDLGGEQFESKKGAYVSRLEDAYWTSVDRSSSFIFPVHRSLVSIS